MNVDGDYVGSVSSGNGKLRLWLIEQVDSGKYPGWCGRTRRRTSSGSPGNTPEAGLQPRRGCRAFQVVPVTCVQAWALFKGKFREGIDKLDPPTWKTRLRCALNKSNDFDELVDRSQLDISDPYKVYRVIPEGAKKRPRQEDSPLSPTSYQGPYPALQTQMPQYMPTPEGGWRDYCQEPASLPELLTQCPCPPRSLPWQGPSMENGTLLHIQMIPAQSPIYSYADSQPSPFTLDTGIRSAEALSDFRLHVSVYFRDALVREVTTSSPEGCHLTPCSPEEKHYLTPGGPEVVPLPVDSLSSQRRTDEGPPSPPSTLGRGVLLWMGSDGLYARRLCPGRVYWQGGLSQYGDKLNKLEREVTCKLLHTQDYLTEIQSYGLHGRPLPRFQVLLSFGDDILDAQRQRQSLTVQVEPLFARQLLYYAQQMGGHYYRSYEHPGVTDHINTSEDYQRTITHHLHSSSLQE
ncbi:hypothetical protein F7725_028080 [Dissostichus mawsoni]|uniref:IRF tryptophan pentad repeat domain-containing protein n=1 Tax=Dissostichus mawsoni TaxID=36200 RepID=A0A7J5XER6_DISMA|nr:hypothetical protein F7725_028080 [Dissostichus mawsoni]